MIAVIARVALVAMYVATYASWPALARELALPAAGLFALTLAADVRWERRRRNDA